MGKKKAAARASNHSSKPGGNKAKGKGPNAVPSGKYHAAELQRMREQLKVFNLRIVPIAEDGNCFFRSVADQMEGNPAEHLQYRERICDYILALRENFEPFIDEDIGFDDYIASMRKEGEWAGHIELQAFTQLFNVGAIIHQPDAPRLEIPAPNGSKRCVHLSYHRGEHYASVRRVDDPGDGPALPIIMGNGAKKQEDEISKEEKIVMESTGCSDISTVKQTLEDAWGDVDAAIEMLIETMNAQRMLEESVMCASAADADAEADAVAVAVALSLNDSTSAHVEKTPQQKKMTKRERKAQKQQEKMVARRNKAEVDDAETSPSEPVVGKAEASLSYSTD